MKTKISVSNNPMVSVIVPNYNYARFLDQRLDTIFSQTYRNFEVIILDDCSTDNSLEIINQYSSDSRVSHVVVNEHNSGSTFIQWEKGLCLAKGEIVWIAETDDFCELNFLEELVKAYLKKKGTVIAYSKVLMVNEDGVPYRAINPSHPRPFLSVGGLSFHNLKEHLKSFHRRFKYGNRYLSGQSFLKRYQLCTSAVTNASGAIFSREAARLVSDTYTKAKAAGDYFFWTELAYYGKVAIVNRPLAYWRYHSKNVTFSNTSNGMNILANKQIYDSIVSNLKLSPLRRRIARACQVKTVESVHYSSEEIERMCTSVWEVEKNDGFFDKFLYCLHSKAVHYFNYYL